MKARWIYILWILLVLGSLAAIGVYFYLRDELVYLWVLEGVTLMGIILSVFFYRRLIKPYQLILEGVQLLKEQDFSTILRPVKNRDADEIINIFNRMIRQLRSERLQVREKNQFLDLLINASPQAILILDSEDRIKELNPACVRILHIPDIESVKGIKLKDAGFELAPSLAALKKDEREVLRDSSMSMFHCVRSSFVDQGYDHPFVIVEELTREIMKLEKKSYERIIRMMSHEVNNSVGAIGATLHVVSDIFKQTQEGTWEDVLPAIDASYERCGHLAQFISNLAQVVRLPEPTLSYLSLNEQVRSVNALTQIECMKRNIQLILDLDEKDYLVYIDGIQFGQVLVNIVKNAYESIGKDGTIRIKTTSSPAAIFIQDDGPGIQPSTREKLFTPFFTTKESGQGIGLMFIREVLLNHDCRFNLYTENNLTTFEIYF